MLLTKLLPMVFFLSETLGLLGVLYMLRILGNLEIIDISDQDIASGLKKNQYDLYIVYFYSIFLIDPSIFFPLAPFSTSKMHANFHKAMCP